VVVKGRSTIQVNGSAWDRGLEVTADGRGLIGHAGAVLLRRLADRVGLTAALGAVFAVGGPGWIDRGVVLAQTAVAIACGARNVADVERLGRHHGGLFGTTGSDSTIGRTLAAFDDVLLARLARARARVRAVVWTLLGLRPGGFPWLTIAGKHVKSWLVLDMDATIITAESAKQGATGTFKKTFGFHPLAAWLANTGECLAMLLRPGNSGSNTAADHIEVLAAAFAQVPGLTWAKILVRIDGAGASHDLTEHLERLSTSRRRVRFTTGWKITGADEAAIRSLPASAWETMLDQSGAVLPADHGAVAELTGLNTRTGWIDGLRLIARRVRPSARDAKQLTDFEKKTGWKYHVTATNIGARGLTGIPGTGHAQWIDAVHRHHAVVEDRVRTNKALGLANLPSAKWDTNRGWVLAANLAADLDAWLRLLTLHDQPDLVRAEPDSMRFRLYAIPARLAHHARRTRLRLNANWPWAGAITRAWSRIGDLTLPATT
jgi:hypothetical protein